MTIEGLAAEADIHYTYLWRIENGERKPTWGVVCRIATALEIDLGKLAHLAADQAG